MLGLGMYVYAILPNAQAVKNKELQNQSFG